MRRILVRQESAERLAYSLYVSFLYHNGFQTVTVDDIWKENYEKTTKIIAITFDDGYLNNFEIALPILEKYNFKATIFLASNLMGKNNKYINRNQASTIDL